MKLKKLMKKTLKAGHSIPCDLPQGFRLDKKGELILPKTDAACADLLYATREARLQLQRQCERLEKGEAALKEHFINALPKSSASGIAGLIARIQIETKLMPTVEDWAVLQRYIKLNDAFDLLQRRLNENAVKERWNDSVEIPGVTTIQIKKVSCVKV
jgi:hypothetical protein